MKHVITFAQAINIEVRDDHNQPVDAFLFPLLLLSFWCPARAYNLVRSALPGLVRWCIGWREDLRLIGLAATLLLKERAYAYY